jgi:hypothetical protein
MKGVSTLKTMWIFLAILGIAFAAALDLKRGTFTLLPLAVLAIGVGWWLGRNGI